MPALVASRCCGHGPFDFAQGRSARSYNAAPVAAGSPLPAVVVIPAFVASRAAGEGLHAVTSATGSPLPAVVVMPALFVFPAAGKGLPATTVGRTRGRAALD